MSAMGLKKCPVCGEKYADTYKRCPFCEEEANPRQARQPKRNEGGGRRLARRTYEEDTPRPLYGGEEGPAYEGRRARREDYDSEEEYIPRRRSRREEEYEDDGYDEYEDYGEYYEDDDRGSPWFKVVMVILIAIIIACLLYLGRGVIGSLVNHDPVDPAPSSSMNSDNAPEDPDQPDQSDLTDPNAGTEPTVEDNPDDTQDDDTNAPDDTTQPEDDTTAAGPLTLSHEDVSLSGDESFTLSVRSGSGTATYTSKDPSIASVSASGVVTGLKKGTTEITVQRGSARAVCIVRVKSDGKNAASSSGGAASGKLSSEDFTLKVGENYTLKVQGITTAVTWSVADSSVATVNGSGKVTGVKSGTTTVTASWDGQKATCIVRVKN